MADGSTFDKSACATKPCLRLELGPIPAIEPGSTTFQYLFACKGIAVPDNTTLDSLLEHSNKFPVKFPIQSVLCKMLLTQGDVTRDILEDNINSAYPVLHEAALYLFINFLAHKKQHGSALEKEFYAGMTLIDLVQRLLDKRAVMFFDNTDHYLLLNGKRGNGGWENIGKTSGTLTLEDCLSYDEMKLSALLSVSSHSIFINDGRRTNEGIPTDDLGKIQRSGVVIGLIGARLERSDYMEWQELIVTKKQNTSSKGYGVSTPNLDDGGKIYLWRQIWASFYGISHFPTYHELVDSLLSRDKELERNFVKVSAGEYFNNLAFQKRILVSIETLLLEAQHRAAVQGTKAFIHVVGIGLGVWMVSSHQTKLFLDTYASCLRKLSTRLTHVAEVHFSWFRENMCGGVGNGESIGDIRISFSSKAPHAKLFGSEKLLLVVSYAWDGNALPGNEFWVGMLSASGDPAEASSSQIAELHNPHVNCTHVAGRNLHVASNTWGIVHIADYATRKLQVPVGQELQACNL